MAKYIIQWCEEKQTKIGPKLETTLRDEKGQDLTGVTLWAKNWPNYQTLKSGDEVEGDIISKQNGQYLNITLWPPKNNLGPRPEWAKKEDKIKAAQERKAGYIEQAQDRKELSIAYFNSCNLAIQALGRVEDTEHRRLDLWKNQFIHLRDFFLEEWKKWDAKDITEKTNPF